MRNKFAVVKIMGGLGNQMFQYAFGKSLARRFHVGVLYDTSQYAQSTVHQGFELESVFGLSLPLAGQEHLSKAMGWCKTPLIRRLLWRFEAAHYVKDANHSVFRPPACDATHYDGYWQSERHFRDCEVEIRAAFQFKKPLTGKNMLLASRIGNTTSVSIHVRRGDYIDNPKANRYHGTCSPDYYRAATTEIRRYIQDPTFFVFSDDPEWAAAHLHVPGSVEYVSWNSGQECYNDMRLMSLCAHNIIANSSFSWWGAWLNRAVNKIVIAPRQWYADAAANRTRTGIPDTWIKI